MPLQIRRGTNAERLANAVPFAVGELIYVTDTKKLYIGDGSLQGVQVTGFDATNAIDAVAGALKAGINTNISFTYGTTQQLAGRIDTTVSLDTLLTDLDLNGNSITGTGGIDITGNIVATSITANVIADDATELVNTSTKKIFLDGTVSTDVIPDTNISYDIGAPSYRFKDLYLSGSSIYLGAATISASGSVVNLPAGSTVGGNKVLTADVDGIFNADINGSVFGDDSSVIIDGTSGFITTARISSASGRLDVGSTAATTNLYVYEDQTSNGAGITIRSLVDGAPGIGQQGAIFRYFSSKGTLDTPAVLDIDDQLGSLQFGGYVNGGAGGEINNIGLAAVKAVIADVGDVVSNFAKAKLQFFVGNGNNPADAKTAEFDYKGTFSAPVFKPGSFTTTERDALTPEVGMMIYNTTANKFQGYQNTGGTTLEWVDLS